MLLSVTVNMFHEIFYQSDRGFLVCKNSQSLECLFLQNDCMLVEQAFLRHCAGCIMMHYCLQYNCKEVICVSTISKHNAQYSYSPPRKIKSAQHHKRKSCARVNLRKSMNGSYFTLKLNGKKINFWIK